MIVTIVIIMVSLAGFSFVALMSTEHKAVRLHGEELQVAAAVASGEEFLKALLQQSTRTGNASAYLSDNAELFRAVTVFEDEVSATRTLFSVISPHLEDEALAGIRFGLANESSRLNLRALVHWDLIRPGAASEALMHLPDMTESIADALLDWIDGDARQRPLGAEADYYLGLDPPYEPRNGVPDSLEELLLVRGVTRQLLFGPDTNLNYRIESVEQIEEGGLDDAVSTDALPWALLLTLHSAERNVTTSGSQRIDMNDPDLKSLYNQLDQVLEESWASFIIAYRQYGPYRGGLPVTPEAEFKIDFSVPARYSLNSALDLVDVNVRIREPRSKTVLASPVSSEPQALRDHLPKLIEHLSPTKALVIAGRINVNSAPRTVLEAVPGLQSDLVDQVLAGRSGQGEQPDDSRSDATWLLTEGVVDLATMKAIMPYVTTRGDVYRGQIVGFLDRPGPVKRVEVVIDSTRRPTRQVYWKDLQVVGPGFSRQTLGAESFIETVGNTDNGFEDLNTGEF